MTDKEYKNKDGGKDRGKLREKIEDLIDYVAGATYAYQGWEKEIDEILALIPQEEVTLHPEQTEKPKQEAKGEPEWCECKPDGKLYTHNRDSQGNDICGKCDRVMKPPRKEIKPLKGNILSYGEPLSHLVDKVQDLIADNKLLWERVERGER